MPNPRERTSAIYKPEANPQDIEIVDANHRLPPNLVASEAVDWRDVNYLGEQIIAVDESVPRPSEGQIIVGVDDGTVPPLLLDVGEVGDHMTKPDGDTKPRWIKAHHCNLYDYGAVGDGLTDDTVAVRKAFAEADRLSRPVFIPPASFLTDVINYRMVSIIGADPIRSVLRGKPGKDLLHLDPTYGQFTRMGGCWRTFTLELDDSLNAAANFPTRMGVGNACFASDFYDSAVSIPYPPMAIDWNYDHVRFVSLSMASGGQNNSVGIFEQSSHFAQCNLRSIQFWRLQFGWWNDWPRLNISQRSLSHDHVNCSQIHFNLCKNNWRMVNWGFAKLDDIILHDAVGGTSWEMKGVSAGASGGNNVHDLHISAVELEGATVAGLVTDNAVNNLKIENMSISNVAAPVIWNGHASRFKNLSLNGITGTHAPVLTINGHRNEFEINDGGGNTVAYGFDLVNDLGVGNKVLVRNRPGSQSAYYRQMESSVPDGRILHQRDTISQLLGHVDPLFVSGSDLILNPRSMTPPTQAEGTAFTYVADPAADFRVAMRMLTATGVFNLDETLLSINGKNGARVGSFLPPGKVRVYVKAKLATAGTMRAILQAPVAGTTRGQVTATIGTAYTVLSFDADLTGVAADTQFNLRMDSLAGGGVTPLDVAWIAFRPWARDWLDQSKQAGTNNGDADKTLVVGTDPEKQRWTTALTAARTVTLSTTNAHNGASFRLTRPATGAFNLTIMPGTLKAVAAGQWAEVTFDGTAWYLSAFGSL